MEIVTNRILEGVEEGRARVACVFTGRETTISADWVLPLTRREPNDALYRDLLAGRQASTLRSLHRVGDCEAPGIIASAVYSGYRVAREMEGRGGPRADEVRRERSHV